MGAKGRCGESNRMLDHLIGLFLLVWDAACKDCVMKWGWSPMAAITVQDIIYYNHSNMLC